MEKKTILFICAFYLFVSYFIVTFRMPESGIKLLYKLKSVTLTITTATTIIKTTTSTTITTTTTTTTKTNTTITITNTTILLDKLKNNTLNEVASFPEFSKKKINTCVERSIDGSPTFVTCVKDPNTDEHISGSIIRGGVWEGNIIKQEMMAMNQFPQAIFLDVGSNIGVHTLAVAAMNRSVVAVDAVYDNLAFISESRKIQGEKNLTMGSVRLVYNSISDHHEILYPITTDERNAGGTFLLTKEQVASQKINKSQISAPPVNSVTTLEILQWINAEQIVMKIDVEGFECQALTASVLDQSSGTFIPYVFMEWNLISKNFNGRCPDHKELAMRFVNNSYVPKDANTMADLPDNSDLWGDVAWVHQSKGSRILHL